VATELQHEPTIIEREAQPYVGIVRPVTMTTFAEIADRLPDLFGWLAQHAVAPAGPPFFRYLVIDMERELVVEGGVPTAAPVARNGDPGGDVQAGTLPAGRYLTVVHTGHPDELVDVTTAFLAWAAEHGLSFDVEPSPQGDVWGCRLELLLTNPAEVPDMHAWQTQLMFRLR
jgi:effector-binding domain-containing protein